MCGWLCFAPNDEWLLCASLLIVLLVHRSSAYAFDSSRSSQILQVRFTFFKFASDSSGSLQILSQSNRPPQSRSVPSSSDPQHRRCRPIAAANCLGPGASTGIAFSILPLSFAILSIDNLPHLAQFSFAFPFGAKFGSVSSAVQILRPL